MASSVNSPPIQYLCNSGDCKELAKEMCGGCEVAMYCGAECQGTAWGTHKVFCRWVSTRRKQPDLDLSARKTALLEKSPKLNTEKVYNLFIKEAYLLRCAKRTYQQPQEAKDQTKEIIEFCKITPITCPQNNQTARNISDAFNKMQDELLRPLDEIDNPDLSEETRSSLLYQYLQDPSLETTQMLNQYGMRIDTIEIALKLLKVIVAINR